MLDIDIAAVDDDVRNPEFARQQWSRLQRDLNGKRADGLVAARRILQRHAPGFESDAAALGQSQGSAVDFRNKLVANHILQDLFGSLGKRGIADAALQQDDRGGDQHQDGDRQCGEKACAMVQQPARPRRVDDDGIFGIGRRQRMQRGETRARQVAVVTTVNCHLTSFRSPRHCLSELRHVPDYPGLFGHWP